MKITKILLVISALLLLWATPTVAAEWSTFDTYIQIGFAALTIFDIYQTDIAIQSGAAVEANPLVVLLVGPRPDTQTLYNLGIYWVLVHTLITYMLPSDVRRVWQIVTIIWTYSDVANSVGTKIVFRFPLRQ